MIPVDMEHVDHRIRCKVMNRLPSLQGRATPYLGMPGKSAVPESFHAISMNGVEIQLLPPVVIRRIVSSLHGIVYPPWIDPNDNTLGRSAEGGSLGKKRPAPKYPNLDAQLALVRDDRLSHGIRFVVGTPPQAVEELENLVDFGFKFGGHISLNDCPSHQ